MDYDNGIEYNGNEKPFQNEWRFSFWKGEMYSDVIQEELYCNAVFFNLAIEGSQPYLEQTGGFGFVALCIDEHLDNVATLHAF